MAMDIGNGTGPAPAPSGDVAMENLYPALVECFAIILCGYGAGRAGMISTTEAKGLNAFVSTFCLPSLIFLSLAQLELSAVNWTFLASVLAAKASVFAAVVVVTLLVSRPLNPGRAALFAMFATQSNDFAIGYPIVVALYGSTHPEYASYLYLMAPISLAILNPLGFVLLELGKRRGVESEMNAAPRGRLRLAAAVARSVLLNPVVAMTLLGMLGNLAFAHRLPLVITQILKVLGEAFPAAALFLLGLRMVGKVHTLQGPALLVPGVLIAAKLLALPLVTREMVSLMGAGANASDTTDLSTYGFLYGTFPSAPTVFVFASQFGVDVDLIASSMVACTFISAPLMFVSARMVTVTDMSPTSYLRELDAFAFDISIAGLIACVWVLGVLAFSRRWQQLPHRLTCCLVVSQLIGCVGIILWSTLDRSHAWSLYLQFAVYTIGVYSSRLWTAFLAIGLLLLSSRSLCFVLKLVPLFIVVGWGLPLLLVTVLTLTVDRGAIDTTNCNPNFQYGTAQAAVSTFLLLVCFIVTVGCVVMTQRYQRRHARYLLLVQDASADRDEVTTDSASLSVNGPSACDTPGQCQANGCGGVPQVVDIEELSTGRLLRAAPGELCPDRFGCPAARREQCLARVRAAACPADRQVTRHTALLVLLSCSMFVGLALSTWTLVMEQVSGIYVELAFLDAALNFGQSLLVFACFGLDIAAIWAPMLKRWRCWWHGEETLSLPPWDDLSFETRHVCDQFITHHLLKCKRDIARDKRCRLKQYKQAFAGTALVDWLLGVGLARDRIEAVQYARHLLDGRLIRHVTNVHHFHDGPLVFTFAPAPQSTPVTDETER